MTKLTIDDISDLRAYERERDEFRLGEHAATLVLGALGPVLPKKWRINPAERIASVMVEAAVAGKAGVAIVGPEALATAP